MWWPATRTIRSIAARTWTRRTKPSGPAMATTPRKFCLPKTLAASSKAFPWRAENSRVWKGGSDGGSSGKSRPISVVSKNSTGQKKADGPTETVGAPVRPTEEGRPQKTMACPTVRCIRGLFSCTALRNPQLLLYAFQRDAFGFRIPQQHHEELRHHHGGEKDKGRAAGFRGD